jgi:hypothetical protein
LIIEAIVTAPTSGGLKALAQPLKDKREGLLLEHNVFYSPTLSHEKFTLSPYFGPNVHENVKV